MSAEAKELDRDAVALMTHDLRGVASALSLRADVLANVLTPNDRAAFKSLSAELLELDIALQVSRDYSTQHSSGSDVRVSGQRWWHSVSRLSSTALPRRSRQHADIGDVELTLREASLLTHVWQAACKDLAATVGAAPVQVELTLVKLSDGGGIELSARLTSNLPDDFDLKGDGSDIAASRWHRYAKRRAKENRATLTWWNRTDSGLAWCCAL